MAPEARSSARVRVGSFELDLHTGELRSSAGDQVLLREQPLQVLRMLVERDGKMVSRSEIKAKLWPNSTIVDFDHSINVAIGVLRRAFGDSAATPRYIETLARRGYRMLAAIERLESEAPAGEPVVPAEATRQLSDLIGKKVSQYRVLEVLGGGGMGMVYKAEDLRLGRHAALKFLPEELAGDSIALQRLEREARTASALNHPNICTIYGIEEYQGQKFIAMELLEGETLQQRLAAFAPGAVPATLLIDIAIQVCLGLEAAHAKAIVHRDIKPANIFLTKEGVAKILDFGIAKLVAHDAAGEIGENHPSGASEPQQGLTRVGATVGTSGYMSPEQVRAEHLDGRSDLFSLGLVLYEMATGMRAFAGTTSIEVQDAILGTTPPSAEALNAAMPRAVSHVIAKAIEKDRTLRYQTASDMRQELERARPQSRSNARRRWRWPGAAAAVLAIVAAASWSMWPRGRVVLAPSDTIVIAHLTNATSDRVFDEALYTALRISLEQTPYLNVLADNKVRGSLASIKVDPAARITPEVALQVCRQTGSKIVIAPSIADAGNQLRLQLRAIDCQSGSSVTQLARQAASRDDVVDTLGSLAVEMRKELGEPAASVSKYNVPLSEASSRSPEALELLTLGYRAQLDQGSRAAIEHYERAVQADPSLALAHAALSAAYSNIADSTLSEASGRKAFAMRDRLTAPARFSVENNYYLLVLGNFESACTIGADWVQAFPQDFIARTNFARCLSILGEPDRALGESREAARLLPAAFTHAAWALRSVWADRLDEAQRVVDDARQRGFDSPNLRDVQVQLAFFAGDTAAMQQQWTWAGRAGAAQLIMGKAMVEASQGRLSAAVLSVKAAVAMNDDLDYVIDEALIRAEIGLSPTLVITVAPNQTLHTRLHGTLALARTGRIEQARQAADALRRDFPSNTIVQKYGLPLIDGAVQLQSGNAAAAAALMKPSVNYDLTSWEVIQPLYSAYVRGLAYLRSGDPGAAAAEFQKVLLHRGLVGRGVIGPLARLQLARAQNAVGDTAAAIGSYEAFLDLWRDADADLPAYVAAKTEYAKLRKRQ